MGTDIVFIIFGIISVLFPVLFWGVFVTIIVKAIKASRQKNNYTNTNAGNYKQVSNEKPVNIRKENSHNHAYKHKVKPIKEATVMQQHYEKLEEQEQKRAEREAMYNEGRGSSGSSYEGNKAKNGDYGDIPTVNEKLIVCNYCGAKNIVPKCSSVKYQCYFCRQMME